VLNTTEKYALNKNQKYGYNTFLNNKGVFFDVNGMSDSAKIYFEKAANYSVKNKFPIQEQYSYNNLGMYFWNKGKFQDALTSFFKSLKLAEENVKKDATIKVDATLNNIGLIYQEMTLYEKALPYHQKALKIRSQRKFEQGESSSYNNLGICYKELNKISLAKQSFESGILKATLAQDKVIYYQNLEGLASVYVIENQNQKALELFLESYNRSKEIPFSSNSFVHVTSSISKLYLKLNNTKKAIEFGEMCVLKINEEKSTEYYEPEVYKTLAESYYKVGDSKKGAFYNNLFYQNTINKFKESNGKALQELETKYETEKKERELFQSKAENSIKEAQIQKKNGLIFTRINRFFVF
jgi:tetratricopeptide (TPR) repeat protein